MSERLTKVADSHLDSPQRNSPTRWWRSAAAAGAAHLAPVAAAQESAKPRRPAHPVARDRFAAPSLVAPRADDQ